MQREFKMTHATYPHSYYAHSALAAPERPPLQGDIETDVCVIGAGYTGLSTALFLLEHGFRVVVLEAAKVGFGASGRNGGQIVNSYSRDIDVIERSTDPRAAHLLGEMAFEGGRIIRERIARYGIACDLKDGGVFAAFTARQMHHLEAQKRLWERYGHTQLELLDRSAIRRSVATDNYVGGLLDRSGGHIHPLNLALGEAAAVESLGGIIHERSPVLRIERGSNPAAHTAQGRVRAKFLVVAGNAYLGNLLPELAAKSMPCGSQVIATEPLGARLDECLATRAAIYDTRFAFDYYRPLPDTRLLWGGRISVRDRSPRAVQRLLLRDLLKVFPQLQGVRVEYAWAGLMSYARHQMPQLGSDGRGLWWAQAFGGHGLSSTCAAGELLAAAIAEGDLSWRQFDAFGLARAWRPFGLFAAQASYWRAESRDWLKRRMEG
jgi:gamma-glutamylputrescine oxidase